MDSTDLPTLKALLRKHNVAPNKTLGQHFLVRSSIVDAVVAAITPTSDDVVLEVGPGAGALTIALAHHAKYVIAIEKSKHILPVLHDVLTENNSNNIEVIQDDILEFLTNETQLKSQLSNVNGQLLVIGALPYYVSSRFFRLLLEESSLPWKTGAFIVQKEVADRMAAKPPKMNLLGLATQLFSDVTIEATIPATAFWPQPDVQSALVTLVPKALSSKSKMLNKTALTLARTAFQQKRKQLKNTLDPDLLQRADIDPTARPQHLSLHDWYTLANN